MPGATPPSNAEDRLSATILQWLARFPLLGEPHLQALLDQDERSVARNLAVLRAQGLVGVVAPDSPEFAGRQRLHYLTGIGAQVVAEAASMTVAEFAERLPVNRDELLARLIRVETAIAVTGFVATLAEQLRSEEEADLEDAWGTRWALAARAAASTPPMVETCLRLRAGNSTALCVLAWDRAAAPRIHRARRIAAWYRADEERRATRGAPLPSVLVVCPDDRAAGQWALAAECGAARRGRAALPLTLVTLAEVAARGPLHARWRQLGESRGTGLLDRLTWRSAPQNDGSSRTARVGASLLAPAAPGTAQPRIGRLMDVTAASCSGSATPARRQRERWAALAADLSAGHKRLLEWVGHHPLLPAAHLSVHMDVPWRSISTWLDDLERRELVACETMRIGHSAVVGRYVLTASGAAFLAARDGVPPRLYLTEGVIIAEGDPPPPAGGEDRGRRARSPVRLAQLRRHPEHTTGVQRFALTLAREAARARASGRDHRLLAWLNEAEAQIWFRHEGRLRHIWPDGRFRYRTDDVVYDLLVEWDRGLVRRRDYARKFDAYAAYFAAHPRAPGDTQRLILVTTAAAEGRLREVLDLAASGCPRLGEVACVLTLGGDRRGKPPNIGPRLLAAAPPNAGPFRLDWDPCSSPPSKGGMPTES